MIPRRTKPVSIRQSTARVISAIALCLTLANCVPGEPLPEPITRGSFVSSSIADADGGPLEIDRPRCAAFGPAHQIAICESGEGEVVAIDSGGHERWRFGRRGNGPAEFRYISGLHFDPAGRLHIFDGHLRKRVVVSADGELISSRVFHELRGFVPQSIGELPDGRMVIVESSYPRSEAGDPTGLQYDMTPLLLLDTANGRAVAFDTLTRAEMFAVGLGYQRVTFDLPFRSSGSAVIAGTAVIRGFARDSFVVRHDPVYNRTDSLPLIAPAFPLRRDDWEREWEERLTKTAPDFRERMRAAEDRVPRFNTYPRYARLFATPGGTVAIYAPLDSMMDRHTIRCIVIAVSESCPDVVTSTGEVVLAIAAGRALVARQTPDGSHQFTIEIRTH
jgi:hypothetical protein